MNAAPGTPFCPSCGGEGLESYDRTGGFMHILLALLAAAGAIGIILWRLHMATEAARGLTQAAEEAHGLFRRWKWRRKLAQDPLDLIQDRREAAVAMMIAVAQSDGAVTERERRTILAEIVQ